MSRTRDCWNFRAYLTIGMATACCSQIASAQSACEVQKLIGSEVTQADIFGVPIVVSGDTLVISAWRDDDNGDNSGAVYVFRFDSAANQWTEQQKLIADDGQPFDRFGVGLACSGDTIFVGVPYDDHEDCIAPPSCDSGSVYVFRFDEDTSQWVQERKLVPLDVELTDFFGFGIAASGDWLIVGSHFDDDNGTDAGAAYAYRYNGKEWIQEQKLLPEDGDAGDIFGLHVAMSDGIAVISATRDDDNGNNSGSAYIFEYNGTVWIERQKLLASNGSPSDYFGRSMAIDNDAMLVGVREDDEQGQNSGSAYVFRNNGQLWIEEQKLVPSDAAEWDWFGSNVALSGDVAVIGASLDDDNGDASGSAYVYRFNGTTWVESEKLHASDGHPSHFFGEAVAATGDTVVIGACSDMEQGIQAGAAYVFVGLSAIDCNTNEISDACEIFGGLTPDFNGNGIPDQCECPWDCGDSDGVVGIGDFLAMLATWGTTGVPCDFDGNGVGITDFLTLLANWGPCL